MAMYSLITVWPLAAVALPPVLNAGRKLFKGKANLAGRLFVSSGLGGMSGAQAKSAVIAGAIGVVAEINPKAVEKRHQQGWVNEIHQNLDTLQ